ncbi:unnamed protein product [Lota lota]
MGQLLSWIRGPNKDNPDLLDVAVEQQSQPSQTTPTPAAQVTTVKPSQFETPPVSQVKAAAAATPSPPSGSDSATMSAGTAASAAQAKPTPKDTAKSAAATAKPPVKDTPKADPAKAAKPVRAGAVTPAAAAADAAVGVSKKEKPEVAKPAQTKVQVEVAPPQAKAAKETPSLDPFDALASSLPTVGPVVPEPVYTGPEVHEHGITAETGVLCGVGDHTLPPNYRFENTPSAPPDIKPKDVPKPMSTDEALDTLSFGFTTAPTPPPPVPQEKVDSADAIHASSAGFSNFAPPPPASVKSPAPPVDKKAKMDTISDDFSLMGALSSPPPPQFDDFSLDALDALGDTLGAPEPVHESPELRPEDIVSEGKVTSKKGVRVGERDDTLPPKYRLSGDKLKDLPTPTPEPSLAPGEALDFLSGDFMTCPTAAPVVQAPSAPPTQAKVENLSAQDALSGEFITPTKGSAVQAPLPSSAKKSPKDDSLSLDALAALGDTLAAPEPAPEPPKLRPEDIVSEGKVTSKKGVRVGEREDTLPPKYRLSGDKLKDLPTPTPEPTLNTGEALDILSGDFLSPSLAPAVQAPVCSLSKPPMPASADADALDALAGDFVATAVVAPAVKCATSQPTQTSRQMSEGTTSAMDALSDSLMDINPVPEPAPLPMKDTAKEKKVVEERLILMGEDDSTLPPEYRPTEEDIKKAAAEAKKPKEKPMGDDAALNLLSSDFALAPVAAPCFVSAPVMQPLVLDSEPLKPMAGPALDSLAGSLLPDAIKKTTKGEKPKGKNKSRSKSKKHHADDPSPIDQLAGELRTDAVSVKKGGKS